MQRIAITLQQYAGYLLIVGLASAFYNAAERAVGWNEKGKSGLIALGISAVIVFVLGALAGKGKQWAGWAGLAVNFLLLSYSGHTAFKTAKGVSSGELDGYLWYKAALFGVVLLLSVFTFIKLGTALRRDKLA